MASIVKLITYPLLFIFSLKGMATAISDPYSKLFNNYQACFILYHLNKNKVVREYNPHHRCETRLAPDSSFKIALSLMAFNEGIINQKTLFKWNGQKGELPEHEQDQNPQTWLQYSVLWVSQQLTPQLGLARIQQYLANFHYGNQNFQGDPGLNNGLTHAWLSSSLKISAFEHLHFLKAMLTQDLAVNQSAIAATLQNLYLGKLSNGYEYYGKTGSGRHGNNERMKNPSRLREGWFVGFVIKGHEKYIFVSNLTDKLPQTTMKPYGSQVLKPLILDLLRQTFKPDSTAD